MKQLTPIFLMILSITYAFGEDQIPNFPIDKSTGKIVYEEIITIDSTITKQILYARAREWFAQKYISSKNVIQMDDKEIGVIVGNATFEVYVKINGIKCPGGEMHYTISLSVKDGKYKYKITDMYHTGLYFGGGYCEDIIARKKGAMTSPFKHTYLLILIQTDAFIKSLIHNLTESMNKSASNTIENW